KIVKLSWNPSAGATAYNVYRGTSAGGELPLPLAANVMATMFTDQNLVNGTKYFYRIAALGAGGTGPKSSEGFATPTGAPPPPTPTGLTAAPGDQQVVLTWTASAGATGYNLYRGTTAGGESATPMMVLGAVTTFTDKPLANGTRMFYKIAA